MAKPKGFDTEHLSGKAREIADSIVALLTERLEGPPDGGGCRAFYSTKEWKERGEEYGSTSVLVLVHDGGDLAMYCNWDYDCPTAVEALRVRLEKLGYYVEQCTSFYSAVYPF